MHIKLHGDSDSLTGDIKYNYAGQAISIPLDQLCLDCTSPTIEVEEDYLGYYEVLSITHDPTCPQRWDVADRWQA